MANLLCHSILFARWSFFILSLSVHLTILFRFVCSIFQLPCNINGLPHDKHGLCKFIFFLFASCNTNRNSMTNVVKPILFLIFHFWICLWFNYFNLCTEIVSTISVFVVLTICLCSLFFVVVRLNTMFCVFFLFSFI